MARNHNQASRKFHDRVARKYDTIYDDVFWEFHDRITWNHLKGFCPSEMGSPVLDLGCGTGKWGLKLLKAGHPTTFVDLSRSMLDEVRAKLEVWSGQPDLAAKAARATVVEADAVDLAGLPDGHFSLVVAMGDVVSICADPARALGSACRVLKPGGIIVFTVDNLLAALDHFVDSGNTEEMGKFVKTGNTHWLTNQKEEQFDVHMFLPGQIEALARARGFEVISRIGKTVLPVRQNKKFFEKEGSMERLVDLEMHLSRDPSALARASHIQIAARKV